MDDACAALCALAAALADELGGSPEVGCDGAREAAPARRYLVEFGRRGSGIRRGPLWFVDAAYGGRNRMPGRGFRAELDDGSRGQARHFAGIVATASRIGVAPTRWLSVHIRRDGLGTADGRLTEEALEFTALIRSGRLSARDAEGWLRSRLCA